ncbi:hypothetical protein AGMMS50293_03730 [Spirochaetia bacterium]|nr:hypothetical protein AGMMS50293_03730 [Spirochaetia bacterium]
MNLREYSLPVGWYPQDSAEISRFLRDFTPLTGNAGAAIAPHAGWFFSGRIAARAVASLDPAAETVAVLGGHLPAGAPPLFATEDAVQTPLGPMVIDAALRSLLFTALEGKEDRYRDNTVEVLLPMLRFFFPQAKLLWLRLPAELSSFEAGKKIAAAAQKLNRKLTVLASTDLTHYGSNYGFTPHGSGAESLTWVKEVNDKNFIRAVESGKSGAVLERAEQDQSCCSAGAVLGAMGFAKERGLGNARLLEYGVSADALPGEEAESFVGYGAFVF